MKALTEAVVGSEVELEVELSSNAGPDTKTHTVEVTEVDGDTLTGEVTQYGETDTVTVDVSTMEFSMIGPNFQPIVSVDGVEVTDDDDDTGSSWYVYDTLRRQNVETMVPTRDDADRIAADYADKWEGRGDHLNGAENVMSRLTIAEHC